MDDAGCYTAFESLKGIPRSPVDMRAAETVYNGNLRMQCGILNINICGSFYRLRPSDVAGGELVRKGRSEALSRT